jgi:hypothetical protein
MPPAEVRPKLLHTLTAYWFSSYRRMTKPGHCDGLAGIVLYASATSHTDTCTPGGRCVMSCTMVEKVPQVHGKSSLLMWELINVVSGEGLWGNEKLCIARYFPGFDALGMKDRGEVWKGPNSASGSAREKGPM